MDSLTFVDERSREKKTRKKEEEEEKKKKIGNRGEERKKKETGVYNWLVLAHPAPASSTLASWESRPPQASSYFLYSSLFSLRRFVVRSSPVSWIGNQCRSIDSRRRFPCARDRQFVERGSIREPNLLRSFVCCFLRWLLIDLVIGSDWTLK